MPSRSPLCTINDFVVRLANGNGSGSDNATEPSAEGRGCEAGPLGAGGGYGLMVAMNPQTWHKDVPGIEPGGYLFYDSTKPMPESKFRSDIVVLGVPLTAICNRESTDPRQRQLFKNIIYL